MHELMRGDRHVNTPALSKVCLVSQGMLESVLDMPFIIVCTSHCFCL